MVCWLCACSLRDLFCYIGICGCLWLNNVDLVISFLVACGWFNGCYDYGCCGSWFGFTGYYFAMCCIVMICGLWRLLRCLCL